MTASCFSMLCASSVFAVRGTLENGETSQSVTEVERIVRQLGSDHYVRREQARTKLLALGQQAFDSLYVAMHDADTEVRLQAESLMQSLEIVLARPGDSEEIRREIERYENTSAAAKLDVFDRLAAMPNDEGRSALCRIARFESSEFISKKAALAFFDAERPNDELRIEQLTALVNDELRTSRRPSAEWLRAYAAYLKSPDASIDQWTKLMQLEEQAYRDSRSISQKQLINELLHWHVFALDKLDRREESVAVIKRAMALLVVTPMDVVEQLDWLTDHKAWPVVDELAAAHEETIKVNALMTYQLARSYRLRGDTQKANETKQQAFEMTDDPQTRFIIGQELRMRTELDWFEHEYRAAIEDERSGLPETLDALIQIADMQLDWQHYAECISTVEETIEKAKTDEELYQRFLKSSWSNKLQSMRSIAESRILGQKGDRAKQRELLQAALDQEPENIDILIEMYRLPNNTESFQNKVESVITETTRDFQLQIDEAGSAFRRQAFGSYRISLETFYNQYAWLVSNTFGDYQLALEYSKKSLELRPNSPDYLDTLARCYYALEDYESAVIHQRRASKLKPYLGQVKRQKDLFEKVYAEKRQETAAANTTTAN